MTSELVSCCKTKNLTIIMILCGHSSACLHIILKSY